MALQKVFERAIFLTHSFIIQVTILFTQHIFTEHSLFARHMLISVNTKVTKNRATILMELSALITVVAWPWPSHILQPSFTYKNEVAWTLTINNLFPC